MNYKCFKEVEILKPFKSHLLAIFVFILILTFFLTLLVNAIIAGNIH